MRSVVEVTGLKKINVISDLFTKYHLLGVYLRSENLIATLRCEKDCKTCIQSNLMSLSLGLGGVNIDCSGSGENSGCEKCSVNNGTYSEGRSDDTLAF